MRNTFLVVFLLATVSTVPSWAVEPAGSAPTASATPVDTPLAPGLKMQGETIIDAPINFLTGTPAVNTDGTVNAVVEIPAGTSAKWEVKDDGKLRWDLKDGKPRVVKYLGYVGDYGMVPQTKQGDSDPSDILLLAPAYPRGSVIAVRVIGALLFVDKDGQDNKLLAVVPGTPMASVSSLRELDEQFPGVTDIVRIWFEHYKGPKNEMVFKGMADKEEAMKLLQDAETRYAKDQAEQKPMGK